MSKRTSDELLFSPTKESDLKRPDTKISPVKESVMATSMTLEEQQRADTILRIQKEAPQWFVDAFSFTISEISELKIHNNEALTSKVGALQHQITNLQDTVAEKDSRINKLEDEVIQLEQYNRRDNLIIDGIEETPNENTASKVRKFFTDKLGLQGEDIPLTRCH